MEIRIIVERLDPPCGRPSVVAEPSQCQHQPDPAVSCFTGWPGLLKALYQLTGGGGA